MDNVFNEGDKIKVKLLEVDPRTGKFKLSRKALMPRPERSEEPDRPERQDRPRTDRPDRPERNRY